MVAINVKRRSVRQLSLTSAVEDGFWEGRRPFRKAAGTARRQAREGAAGAGRTDLRAGDKRSLRLWHKPQRSSTTYPPRSGHQGESLAGTEWKTKIRPLTALGRFGRLGAAAERLSILERIKRSIIKHIGSSRYLAYGRLL